MSAFSVNCLPFGEGQRQQQENRTAKRELLPPGADCSGCASNRNTQGMSTPTTPLRTHFLLPPKPNQAAMFIVFVVVFIDLLGFGIVLP